MGCALVTHLPFMHLACRCQNTISIRRSSSHCPLAKHGGQKENQPTFPSQSTHFGLSLFFLTQTPPPPPSCPQLLPGGASAEVLEDVAAYRTVKSGAYLFQPLDIATSVVAPGGIVLIMRGELVQQIHSQFGSTLQPPPLQRAARLYGGVSVQVGGSDDVA